MEGQNGHVLHEHGAAHYQAFSDDGDGKTIYGNLKQRRVMEEMEIIDDLATRWVERKHGDNTYQEHPNGDMGFTEEAQDDYNYIYTKIEALI